MTSTDLPSGTGLTPMEELSYEEAFAELEGIVSSLESDDSSLEQAWRFTSADRGWSGFVLSCWTRPS
jgi:hypothetical protein